MIPRVEPLLREALAANSEYQEAEQSIRAITERVILMGGVTMRRDEARASRSRRDSAATRLHEAVQRVQELGCVVKDLDTGLVDFPTMFRGQQVCLCWKLGEPAIGFWHGLEEGFAGRKAIDQDFRDHHQGDRTQ